MAGGDDETRAALADLSVGGRAALEREGLRESSIEGTKLDPRSLALVRVAALIALDAPPATYGREVSAAREAGISAEEILGVLRGVAPVVGAARVVAAAPEIMLALGMDLEAEPSWDPDR